ncbi:MAG: TRAP transporter small permease [Clostridiales bacterium]|nr:TRAP transporter small permease [Clostridiales bacterium]
MKTMKILNAIVYWVNWAMRKIGAIVLTIIFLSITVGILSRYLFNKPMSWTEELVCFLMVYLCYISAAITTAEKKHLVADFLIAKAPPLFRKIISVISRLLMILFFAVVCISIVRLLPTLVWRSGVLLIHRRFYYYPVLVSCIIMTFDVVVDILNDVFPGYDLIQKKKEEAALLAKQQEEAEALEIQKSMDSFMAESAAELKEEGKA